MRVCVTNTTFFGIGFELFTFRAKAVAYYFSDSCEKRIYYIIFLMAQCYIYNQSGESYEHV